METQTEKVIPDTIRSFFDPLSREMFHLKAMWNTYSELYGTRDAVETIHAVADHAFTIIRFVFHHEMIMCICRMTDNKKVAGHETLTLKQLLHAIEAAGDHAFTAEVMGMLSEIDKACEPIRFIRHNAASHSNLLYKQDSQAHPLPVVEREQFVAIIDLIDEFLNRISTHYTETAFDFDPVMVGTGGNIVYALKKFLSLPE